VLITWIAWKRGSTATPWPWDESDKKEQDWVRENFLAYASLIRIKPEVISQNIVLVGGAGNYFQKLLEVEDKLGNLLLQKD